MAKKDASSKKRPPELLVGTRTKSGTTRELSFKDRAALAAEFNEGRSEYDGRTKYHAEGARKASGDLPGDREDTARARKKAPLLGIRGYGGAVSIPISRQKGAEVPGIEVRAKRKKPSRKS